MRKVRWLSAFAATLLCAMQVLATTWYVNASSATPLGNDGTGTGSAAAPYLTLAKLQTVMVAGDSSYLAGSFEESVNITAAVNLSFRQWLTMPQCVIRGDRAFNPTWVLDSGNEYHATVSGVNTPSAVTYKWDRRIDAFGRHYGFLTQGTGATNAAKIAYVLANSNSWHCNVGGTITAVSVANPTSITCTGHGLTTGDSVTIAGTNTTATTVGTFVVTVTGANTFTIPVNVTSVTTGTGTFTCTNRLYVNIGGGAPASGTIRWLVGGGTSGSKSGILLTNGGNTAVLGASGCVVSGLHFYCFADSAGSAYAVRMEGTNNSVIEDCVGLDACAYHAFGMVNSTQTSSVIRRCSAWGAFAADAGGATCFVIHAANPRTVVGCSIEDCAAYVYPSLDTTGAELAAVASTGITGILTHSDTNPNVLGLDVRRCYVKVFPGTGTKVRKYIGISESVAPADPATFSSYSVRVSDCVFTGGAQLSVGSLGHAAYVRCSIDVTQATPAGYSAAGAVYFLSASATTYTLMQGCEVMMDLDGGAIGNPGVLVDQNHSVRLYNCSVVDVGQDTTTVKRIIGYLSVTGNAVIARDCLLGYAVASGGNQFFLFGDSTLAAGSAQRDVLGCTLLNVVDGQISQRTIGTDISTWAGWSVSGDAQARKSAGGVFLNPYRDTRLNLAGDGATLASPVSPVPFPTGINGLGNSGVRGAWQYKPALKNWPRRRRDRSAAGSRPPSAGFRTRRHIARTAATRNHRHAADTAAV